MMTHSCSRHGSGYSQDRFNAYFRRWLEVGHLSFSMAKRVLICLGRTATRFHSGAGFCHTTILLYTEDGGVHAA